MNGHVRSKELYTKIKSGIKNQGESLELANQLSDASIAYAAILNSDHSRWDAYGEEVKIDFSNLIMLGIERLHPITLALANSFTHPEELKKAFHYLVCASVRLIIAGPAPGGQFEKNIAMVAPQITKKTIKTARELATAMSKDIVPDDVAFASNFSTASVSQTHLARYYLKAINNAYDPTESIRPACLRRAR